MIATTIYFSKNKWNELVRKYDRVLRTMFNRIEFPTAESRDILLDSYLANMSHLLHFAYENHIAPFWYLKQIEQQAREYAAAEFNRHRLSLANQATR